MQSDRCLVSSLVCRVFTPFHGGNTGSNPVGDAKIQKDLGCPHRSFFQVLTVSRYCQNSDWQHPADNVWIRACPGIAGNAGVCTGNRCPEILKLTVVGKYSVQFCPIENSLKSQEHLH
jgi:hypothetical protein